MHPRPRGVARQRGVALLTVLLLVAVMTLLVVAILDDIRFGLRRAGNAQTIVQAQWHALGAEAVARRRIHELSRRTPGRTTLDGDWNGRAVTFPIEDGEGGVVTARVFDATTCFNLNSVVEGALEQWRRRELGVRQYVALLEAIDFDEHQARALADTLVDWIDTDATRSPLGAEDGRYALLRPAYRTSGTLLAEASELRALGGYTAAVYARLRPHVCALPGADLSPINVNTLDADDAPLLAMLTLGALDTAAARRIIAARPVGGWRDHAAFWSQPALAAANVPNPVLEQTELRTRYFGLHAEVEYGDAQVVLSDLFEDKGDGAFALVARRWTPDE
ncbi:type II secretion system minor pseudopilin GspK [Marilutibacter chinensis]|uniref:Type II secretion system protein K n=1 Tax=Marilutibacter chinensis TaxID=2912247 RepID=A0ABS9HX53_9GAMM|nr:type II secretion system minor pseudopilin GspK [Lysobacter chinensis]MCF7222622.1 type II secretion system minor pseudopilin GspK [Lysobacter chinensis]